MFSDLCRIIRTEAMGVLRISNPESTPRQLFFARLTYGQQAWLASIPDFRYPGSRLTEHLPQL